MTKKENVLKEERDIQSKSIDAIENEYIRLNKFIQTKGINSFNVLIDKEMLINNNKVSNKAMPDEGSLKFIDEVLAQKLSQDLLSSFNIDFKLEDNFGYYYWTSHMSGTAKEIRRDSKIKMYIKVVLKNQNILYDKRFPSLLIVDVRGLNTIIDKHKVVVEQGEVDDTLMKLLVEDKNPVSIDKEDITETKNILHKELVEKFGIDLKLKTWFNYWYTLEVKQKEKNVDGFVIPYEIAYMKIYVSKEGIESNNSLVDYEFEVKVKTEAENNIQDINEIKDWYKDYDFSSTDEKILPIKEEKIIGERALETIGLSVPLNKKDIVIKYYHSGLDQDGTLIINLSFQRNNIELTNKKINASITGLNKSKILNKINSISEHQLKLTIPTKEKLAIDFIPNLNGEINEFIYNIISWDIKIDGTVEWNALITSKENEINLSRKMSGTLDGFMTLPELQHKLIEELASEPKLIESDIDGNTRHNFVKHVDVKETIRRVQVNIYRSDSYENLLSIFKNGNEEIELKIEEYRRAIIEWGISNISDIVTKEFGDIEYSNELDIALDQQTRNLLDSTIDTFDSVYSSAKDIIQNLVKELI